MASDRIFGLVVFVVALALIAGALQLQTSFLADPVGSKTFPILIGSIAAICGGYLMWKPDPEPDWPQPLVFVNLAIAVAVMVGYAFALKPMGFLIPTAIAAGILSYQIGPRVVPAILTGIGLSGGLFVLFKYVLGLGLVALPKALLG